MTPNNWRGIFPAVWTPTDADGELQTEVLRENVAFLIHHGVHGFMALGSTGEFALLEPELRKRVFLEIRNAAAGRPVLLNVSDIRPGVVAELGRFAKAEGASGIAVLPPWFYQVDQRDMAEFFVRAGEAAGLPLCLYNFPERTGCRIELETIAAVAARVPVAGFKQSGADFEYHRDLVKLGREQGFVVFSGADTRLDEAMAIGAGGCITGMGNAVPDLLVSIFEARAAHRPETSADARARMTALGPLMGRTWFPLNIVALMRARGLAVGEFKEVVSPESIKLCRELEAEFRALMQSWQLV